MAMVSDVLRESQIRNLREVVYKIVADVDRLLKDIHGTEGIEILGEILKEKVRIEYFQRELSFNQLLSLIAILCNDVFIVYVSSSRNYAFDVSGSSPLRDNIELDGASSCKLKVVGMEAYGVTEIDFSDVRRDLMWHAVTTSVQSPQKKNKSLYKIFKSWLRRH